MQMELDTRADGERLGKLLARRLLKIYGIENENTVDGVRTIIL